MLKKYFINITGMPQQQIYFLKNNEKSTKILTFFAKILPKHVIMIKVTLE